MNYTDITSDGGMDPRNAADTDAARLARHRALHNFLLPPHPEARARDAQRVALANCQHQLGVAIRHLQAILNSQRTATQSWRAEQEARQWLESIGNHDQGNQL